MVKSTIKTNKTALKANRVKLDPLRNCTAEELDDAVARGFSRGMSGLPMEIKVRTTDSSRNPEPGV